MPAQGLAHLYKTHLKWHEVRQQKGAGKWKLKSTAVAPSAFQHFAIKNNVWKHGVRMDVNEIKNQNINHNGILLLDYKSFLYH